MMYYVGQVLHRIKEKDSVILVSAEINLDGFIDNMKGVTKDQEIVDLDPVNISPYFSGDPGLHKRKMFVGDICPKVFGAEELDLDSDPSIVVRLAEYAKNLDVSKLSTRIFKQAK